MKIRTVEGNKTLYKRPAELFGQVVDGRSVGMMNAMMQETLLSGTARKAEIPGWPAAGKTGTSQDFRDAWFIGYTANLVTGVWLGNDDNSPTKKATGGGLAGGSLDPFHAHGASGRAVAALPGGGGFFLELRDRASGQPPARARPASRRSAPSRSRHRRLADGSLGERPASCSRNGRASDDRLSYGQR